MEITIKDLIAKYDWGKIEPVLSRLYPTPKRSLAEYREAYQKFSATVPIRTRMRIIIEEDSNVDLGKWYEVYGKNGTLIKDLFPTKPASQYIRDHWEDEHGYALSYTAWTEIAGMTIDSGTLSSYPETEIVVHLLMEITAHWRSDEQNVKVLDELDAIKQGRVANVVQKEMLVKRGFRQVWSEKENGDFHGLYTVYWENGVIYQQGIMVDDNKEGIWTYWDKNGKLKNQLRCWCDREMELKSESPWWDNATDQHHT